MGIMNLLAFLIVGVAAGWIAGNLLKGRGFGLVGNMVVGVVGAFLDQSGTLPDQSGTLPNS